MTAQLIRSSRLYAGAPYAYASIAPPGSLIFTAGTCPIDGNGDVVAIADYAGQARHALANLATALAAAGATLRDVLKSTVYVASADKADLYDVWQVVHEAFGAHDAPSTLLGASVFKRYTRVLGAPQASAQIKARLVARLATAACSGTPSWT